MNYGFFIVGGVIFATYMGLTFWNIFYSAKKQKEENYPNMKKNMGDKETAPSKEAPSKEVPFTDDTKPTE